MSKPTLREQALSHIAGEVAASGKRPASEVATRILERLERKGINVIHFAQTDALQALIGLDAVFDLSGDKEEIEDLAKQVGIEDATGLIAAIAKVREILDGPGIAEMVASYYADPESVAA
ncbi:hypothetical protein [Methylobacterium sp. J-090]|uniref:hypothetical protein n=1 Tax=Methylobacterium sp. J-090 TaxID=2836666 RepID=UPI001FB86C90|nr:hypothetical protein [Methylobacterium sp. J-090]MCJ2081540.1 hypothetical protein [Methylobacterium sp. J-090]